MKQFALVGGGRVTSCFVTKLPSLSVWLGPVAARSYRLASRIANQLGVGVPVRGYAELDRSAIVLITVPEPQVPGTVEALADAISWKGRVALLCGVADSQALQPLTERGAETGSLHPVTGFHLQRFIAEGSPGAVRVARWLVRELQAKFVEIDSGRLPAYRAALSLSTGVFVPLLEAAMQSLQACGFHKTAASAILERQIQQALRAYCYSGRKSWSGALAAGDLEQVRREFQTLARANPVLGRFYRNTATSALELYGRHPRLKEALHALAASA